MTISVDTFFKIVQGAGASAVLAFFMYLLYSGKLVWSQTVIDKDAVIKDQKQRIDFLETMLNRLMSSTHGSVDIAATLADALLKYHKDEKQ